MFTVCEVQQKNIQTIQSNRGTSIYMDDFTPLLDLSNFLWLPTQEICRVSRIYPTVWSV